MPILKIVAVAIVTAILTVYLKKNTPEIALFSGVAGGLLIIFLLSDYLFDVADYLKNFFDRSGIDSQLVKIIVKIRKLIFHLSNHCHNIGIIFL